MTNFLSGKKKILTMVLGIVSGLLIAFGLDWSEVSVVAGAVVSAASAVSYLLVEGKIDVERIKRAAEDINEIIEYIGVPEGLIAPDEENDEATGQGDTGQGGDLDG